MSGWVSGKCIFIHYNVCIVDPPNKRHCVPNNFVPCGEVVPISEVKKVIFIEKPSL